MSGVTGGGENGDLQEIMNGGANFVHRITAFYKAKQDADEAVKKYGEIANFTAKQAEVDVARSKIADDLKAADELSARKRAEAGQLASQMTADAGVIVEKAKAKAEDVIATAKKRAEQILADAQNIQTSAQVAGSAIQARANDLTRQANELANKQKELDAAMAAAKQSKDKYDAKYATLTAALAAQG